MLIISRASHTTRKPASHFLHRTLSVLATRIEPNVSHTIRPTSPHISSDIVIIRTIARIRGFMKVELCLKNIEGFIHKSIDSALRSTPNHQQLYESVVVYLIKSMWPQPAATVYDRMSNQGYISSDAVDARMLVILLADAQGSVPEKKSTTTKTVLNRILDIVSNPDFSDQHFVAVLGVAEDYNVRPRYVISLIRSFLQAKGTTKYTPRRGIIAAWLRAAVKLQDVDLMRDILELGDNNHNSALKLSAIAEAWQVAEKMDDCLEKLGMRLVGAVANPAVKEKEFLRSLDVIKRVGVNAEIVAQVCASFLANREAEYVPRVEITRAAIEAFIQTDRVDDAFALLSRVGIQPGKRPPYQTFLANLRNSRPADHSSFATLLSAIDAAEIPLDTSLLNILISREVRLNRAANALSLFYEMKQNPDLFQPDAYTFGSLFAMYRRIRPSSARRYHNSHAESLAKPTLPLRRLFHELVESTNRSENRGRVQPNTALLNTALKAFMRQRDYAGAIIVIGTFSMFKVELDNKSYYSVVKLLVRRVWAEALLGSSRREEEEEEIRWVDRFLGVRPRHCGGEMIELGRGLVYGVFGAVCRRRFVLSEPVYVPPERDQRRRRRPWRQRRTEEAGEEGRYAYTFPTMEMMESLEGRPDPVDFVYDPVPLMRLLSRALYAADADVGVGVGAEEAALTRRVDELVREAEGEMIPQLGPL